MTADERFARWVKRTLIGFVAVFAYFLWADLSLPLTPQAMVTRVVTQVTPQVSGTVVEVYVHNNERVKQGAPLFKIDPRPYEIALQQSRLNVHQAQQANEQLDARIRATQAQLTSAKVTAEERRREAQRIQDLMKDGSTSQQAYDQSHSLQLEAEAQVDAVQAELDSLRVQRGETADEHNLSVQQAVNQVEKARLNLSYTTLQAKHDGYVSNLKLNEGAYARQGVPLLALVSPKADIVADFREKNLRHIQPGTHALIVFDAEPGRVYNAWVTSIDEGVNAGQLSADGALAAPVNSNRWVRDAQRIRVHLQLNEPSQKPRAAGAKATVQIVPDSSIKATIAHAQIRILGWLHFIY